MGDVTQPGEADALRLTALLAERTAAGLVPWRGSDLTGFEALGYPARLFRLERAAEPDAGGRRPWRLEMYATVFPGRPLAVLEDRIGAAPTEAVLLPLAREDAGRRAAREVARSIDDLERMRAVAGKGGPTG